jgi:hypothetical protein
MLGVFSVSKQQRCSRVLQELRIGYGAFAGDYRRANALLYVRYAYIFWLVLILKSVSSSDDKFIIYRKTACLLIIYRPGKNNTQA